MGDLILRSDAAGVSTLWLNRPEKLNALSGALMLELDAHLQALAAATDSIGVVVLRGAGRCFSAGVDLAEAGRQERSVPPLRQSQIVERLGCLPQPLIAAVHGHCYTGAMELARTADLIFAAESACFADTHAKWGLTPGWGMSQRLPRRIGRGAAARMMYTCARLGAAEALAVGLADYCVPDAEFDSQLAVLAATIASQSWFSHRGNKQLMRETDGHPLTAGLAHEFFHRPGSAPDLEERIARFSRR